MSRRPPNGSKDDLKGNATRGKCYTSSKKESELQASLHSCKEQKRRLQIRTSCRRLCDLLPFIKGQLDTATTLELTAKYMSYLKQTLPPNILSKVNKAVEANVSCSGKNVEMPQKKRRTVGLKKKTLHGAKPAAKKATEDHVSRRCTQLKICKQVTQPSSTVTSPLTTDQMLPPADGLTTVHAPPILLDKSAVPRGQMLPVCQDQFLSASFQSVEKNWINLTPAFINPTSCAFPPAMIHPTFLPQMGSHPSSSHALWDVDPGLADPVALPSVNFGQAYSCPPEQTTEANFIMPPVEQGPIHSPLVGTTDSDSAVDFTNQPLIPFSMFQSATSNELTPEAGNEPVSDALCDSRLLQEGDLCSSSPLTDSPQDVVNPLWLDLLLDTNGNLCFPDANLVNVVLSPYTGSN
ncbi:hypothetical protein PFLUV_G00024950 [Perca fluviatilis]|uniref:BHLH domain-containing protein n=2 Tax=Perca fluviatilis TaxID=8168 RepID=A0A6A5FFM2_PERFL|nr:uncharacterized protein LOC120546549 isoform X1 [Perca fluviatilis]KAF1394286.1 hypothetical protein PFLUV_G00024950 [Perca fluviatilis]